MPTRRPQQYLAGPGAPDAPLRSSADRAAQQPTAASSDGCSNALGITRTLPLFPVTITTRSSRIRVFCSFSHISAFVPNAVLSVQWLWSARRDVVGSVTPRTALALTCSGYAAGNHRRHRGLVQQPGKGDVVIERPRRQDLAIRSKAAGSPPRRRAAWRVIGRRDEEKWACAHARWDVIQGGELAGEDAMQQRAIGRNTHAMPRHMGTISYSMARKSRL